MKKTTYYLLHSIFLITMGATLVFDGIYGFFGDGILLGTLSPPFRIIGIICALLLIAIVIRNMITGKTQDGELSERGAKIAGITGMLTVPLLYITFVFPLIDKGITIYQVLISTFIFLPMLLANTLETIKAFKPRLFV